MVPTDIPITLPARLSPSRIKDFQQCPKLFHFKALGLSTPPTQATARGTLAHYVFERIFDHPRSERTVENAMGYLRPAWAMMLDPMRARDQVVDPFEIAVRDAEKSWAEHVEPDSAQANRRSREAAEYREIVSVTDEAAFLASTEACVRGWFKMETPSKFDPMERELYVASKVAGVELHGFIDRLDRVVSPEGVSRYYVSDYKTGKPASERFADEAFFQLEVYALLVEQVLNVRVGELRLIYVREGRPNAVMRRKVTTALLGKTSKKIATVWKEIQEAAESGTWTPKKQTLCGWCFFQNACPVFDPSAAGLTRDEIAQRTGAAISQR